MKEIIDLSVIIPMYNAEQTIKLCVDSVIEEVCSLRLDWELLIIDDGLSDNSYSIISSYVEHLNLKHLIKIYRQSNAGVSAARNVGLLHSRGKLIAFNDADDSWTKGRIQKQVNFFKCNPQAIMIAGLYEGMKFKNNGFIRKIAIKDQLFRNHISPTTAMIKKTVVDCNIWFNENMECGEDVDFFNKVILLGDSFLMQEVFASSILGKCSWGDSGLSAKLWKMERGELINIHNIYKGGYVNFVSYFFALIFSLLKYIRRLVISYLRKLKSILHF